MTKLDFLKRELKDLDLSETSDKYQRIYNQLEDGVEIMTKKEIRETVDELNDLYPDHWIN